MERRHFLKLASQAGMTLSLASCAKSWYASRAVKPSVLKPNFLFILADDLGFFDIACCNPNNRFLATPHINKLRSEGMLFTNAYSAGPVCSPTRASIMTGKYPARLGINDYIQPGSSIHLPFEETTIAEALAGQGFSTALFGKWHLGCNERFYPDKHGFTSMFGVSHKGQPGSYFCPYKNNPPIPDCISGEYLTDRLTSEAINYIRKNATNPFFAFVSHYSVHSPHQAKPEARQKFFDRLCAAGTNGGSGSDEVMAVYYAMIENLDENVGKILQSLDDAGVSDRTIVVLFSDNGPTEDRTVSGTSLRGSKSTLYENGIRVPCIVKWPGVLKPGSESKIPICSIDFFSTFCEAVGISSVPVTDGRNILRLISGSQASSRDALYWHYPVKRGTKWRPGGAIRSQELKLIQFYDGDCELYNLNEDPGETQNLSARYPSETASLQKKIFQWRSETTATSL